MSPQVEVLGSSEALDSRGSALRSLDHLKDMES